MAAVNPFGSRSTLETARGKAVIYRLDALEKAGVANVSRLPFSLRVLLESLLRHCDGFAVTEEQVLALAGWRPGRVPEQEIGFMPARVLLQDFTGVPCVVDLAAMRSAIARRGGDPKRINPLIPVDLVIDHSVIVDAFGTPDAFLFNVQKEFERNRERYMLLRWAQKAFNNFRVVPPGTGIVHQVNLEYLAKVAQWREVDGEAVVFPDSVLGTDSHTPMINGLGVVGWGVGGIEAEAVMLGQPYYMLIPEVVGVRLTGELPEGATATDLVLTVTQMLRKHGVVGKFVEFFGEGLNRLPLADRATIGNMAPEYGATIGFFPVDNEVLRYLRFTGRDPELVDLVERYYKEQGLFRTDDTPEPEFSEVLELDMSTVEPSLAGPRRPQDRVALGKVRETFRTALRDYFGKGEAAPAASGGGVAVATRQATELAHGSVVIAAITSCTNTSNPSVMVGAGLLAKKAVERGLKVAPYVKTSLAPGSRVVTDYLEAAGLLPYLEQLGFHVVGYGCTTCIGNSGALPEQVAEVIKERDLVAAAVLSGNRNFEGRINPLVKANYLASPILVVAYALAGTVDIDLTSDPIGYDSEGRPVYLKDIWPSQEEIRDTIAQALRPEMFRERYASVFDGDDEWRSLPVPEGDLYEWDASSTYVQEPPFFADMPDEAGEIADIIGARTLVMLGDSITTDHISPAGAFPADSPAGRWLQERGVHPRDFNSYGSRRGNHEVMMRGTFANIRLRNELVPGKEGGWTRYLPTGELMTVYEAAMKYKEAGIPVVVVAGQEYGSGSSRDWAAKGSFLLGVRAVIAESYERIHRSNLVGMGVLPLQFMPGEGRKRLGLTGEEVFYIEGLRDLRPRQEVVVRAVRPDGSEFSFRTIARIDTPVEVAYYRNGGILQTVLRKLWKGQGAH
ncbi:MAG: aconitate hydratase 1 [Firmicutes bacterium ZCTH02-B6]|nr:MAG: aconitate hydratase 1 [Firmicutes bacterium ZCTH02-B6]